ncbi:MAG TPA: bifunctional DNA primase/polymerase [Pseudonocardiaceae bacterium]|jgi:hypothetical protein|nr:bifunctional DNA primase/polymerase [Pseudonocardiaceae bacterium]
MEWSDSWHGAFRIELRAQAIGLASRGWPVLPGTYPTGSGWSDGVRPAAGLRPAHEDWADQLGADGDQIAQWWNGGPYNLLVATGAKLDAIEVGTDLGRRTAAVLRSSGLPVPIAATPEGRWLFLTNPGQDVSAELAAHEDVIVHGAGSWVPLPPTAFPHGVAHWRVRPEVWSWTLPQSRLIQNAMVAALAGRRSFGAIVPGLVGVDRAVA